ncbi:MAG: KTSC domain-containing protein [Bacteroidetes bacterium]|nr:KTSC domain-containing protein [Bacteroidota bacterium]
MNRIINYRKLFDINQETDLVKLKISYRNLMKEWHPDKFTEDDERKQEAELKSKRIIEAYHFLVSISPETHELNKEAYALTTTNSAIDDFSYKGQNLKITFQDGSVYEYFGIPKNVYTKLSNSLTLSRFARRHIFYSYTYSNVSKPATIA